MFFLNTFTFIYLILKDICNFHNLFFYHSPSHPLLYPENHIQGFLGKLDNHWIDITNIF